MTNNPFEALGLGGQGGLDLSALMAQAQAMQTKMAETQANLEAADFTSELAGVSVTVSGVGELRRIEIADGVVPGVASADLSELADVIVAACRLARQQADDVARSALGAVSGGLGDGFDLFDDEDDNV